MIDTDKQTQDELTGGGEGKEKQRREEQKN